MAALRFEDETRRESFASSLSRLGKGSISVQAEPSMPFEQMRWSMHGGRLSGGRTGAHAMVTWTLVSSFGPRSRSIVCGRSRKGTVLVTIVLGSTWPLSI